MKILITGGYGFIGQALCPYLEEQGHQVHILTRNPRSGQDLHWNPDDDRMDGRIAQPWDAVIHLAGRNIAQARWTPREKQRLVHSRVDGTRFLVQQLLETDSAPRKFIGVSGIGYYHSEETNAFSEESPQGEGFLSNLCQHWEAASDRLIESDHCSRSILRLGVVLDPSGGMLGELIPLYRWGLGGVAGGPDYRLNWISLRDLVRFITYLLEAPETESIYNVCSPESMTQKEFTGLLGSALKRPTPFYMPAGLLKWILGEKAKELILTRYRVIPEKIVESDFCFEHAKPDAFFKELF